MLVNSGSLYCIPGGAVWCLPEPDNCPQQAGVVACPDRLYSCSCCWICFTILCSPVWRGLWRKFLRRRKTFILKIATCYQASQNSSVKWLGCRLDNWNFIPGRTDLFSLPSCADQLWGAPSFLSKWQWHSFPGRKAVWLWSWPCTSI